VVTTVGFIGLGNMGRPMATNVVQGGYDLVVYDLRPEPLEALARVGARVAGSAREVAEQAEVVEIAVPGAEHVEPLVLDPGGVLDGARPGTIIAVHSTIHPDCVRNLATQAEPRGVTVIDAQMSGGSTGAEGKRLCYMVGGDRAAFETCRPIFATSGPHVFHMGPLGMGAVTKVAQQIVTTITILGASEGYRVAHKAGVDLDAFQQLLHVSAGQSHVADNWQTMVPRMDSRMVELFWEGLRPALTLGHELGIPLPGTALVQQLFPRIFTLD
jgi:3-hydroxyisobutyrate dehydrogenase